LQISEGQFIPTSLSFKLCVFVCKSLIQDLSRIQLTYIPKKKPTNFICPVGLQHRILFYVDKANLEDNGIKSGKRTENSSARREICRCSSMTNLH